MQRFFTAFLVFLVSAILAAGGCGSSYWPSSNDATAHAARQSGVAIVDLDEVAKQLGSDADLLKAIGEGEASLNQQLKTLQSSLQEKFRRKSQELASGGDGANSGDHRKELARYEQELNRELSDAQRAAQTRLTSYQKQLFKAFREEVIPAAQEAASERGLGVVLTKNDAVLLAFDDAHNVTEAVVAKLRARRAANLTAAKTDSANDAQRR
jgi:Skp family chaperone for outer membrane proteins